MKQIREVDQNTLIIWTDCGQNIFAFKDGAKLSRLVYEKTIQHKNGSTEFESIDTLYAWALSTLHH